MERPKLFDPDFISRTFFPKMWKENNLAEINWGRCYDWAYYAYCLFSDVKLVTTTHHAWVQWKDRYYDSQWKEVLPGGHHIFMKKDWDDQDFEPMLIDENSIEKFKELWNHHGGGRRFHWNTMLDEIRSQGLRPLRS